MRCYDSRLLAKACPALKNIIVKGFAMHVAILSKPLGDYILMIYYAVKPNVLDNIVQLPFNDRDMKAYSALPMDVKKSCEVEPTKGIPGMHGKRSREAFSLLNYLHAQLRRSQARGRYSALANKAGDIAMYRRGKAAIFNKNGELLKICEPYDSIASFVKNEGDDFQKTEVTDIMRFWLYKNSVRNKKLAAAMNTWNER